jgi:hypothetical protein
MVLLAWIVLLAASMLSSQISRTEEQYHRENNNDLYDEWIRKDSRRSE